MENNGTLHVNFSSLFFFFASFSLKQRRNKYRKEKALACFSSFWACARQLFSHSLFSHASARLHSSFGSLKIEGSTHAQQAHTNTNEIGNSFDGQRRFQALIQFARKRMRLKRKLMQWKLIEHWMIGFKRIRVGTRKAMKLLRRKRAKHRSRNRLWNRLLKWRNVHSEHRLGHWRR
jgi:hypothetical protein